MRVFAISCPQLFQSSSIHRVRQPAVPISTTFVACARATCFSERGVKTMKRTAASVFIYALLVLSVIPVASGATKKKTRAATKETTVVSEPDRAIRGPEVKPEKKQADGGGGEVVTHPGPIPFGPPVEMHLTHASSRKFDLRNLPQTPPQRFERPEREEPAPNPTTMPGLVPPAVERPVVPGPNVQAPGTIMNFDGLDFANWGAGHPPDTNGDVGRDYYIQTINTSIGIFRKSDGVRVAAFTFNTFMSQGNFGNLCDTNNFGDPVVLYDSFEDRWIITDFAFQLNAGGAVINPPGSFQCVAASMSGDPVTGGWHFYSINTAGGLGDYPKFGIWPDGLYMSANMFGYPAGGAFQSARAYAFNKAQMYAGSPTVQVVTFNIGGGDFTVIPSNARLQSGTPPAGTPNYFVSTWQFTNALTVYKFHVNWNSIATSTLTGPDIPIAATSWPNASVANAPSLGGNTLDVLQIRNMMQNQYTSLGGAESLWTTHTVRRGNTTGFAAPRWYQTDVTSGTVNPNITQAATWDPDGANVIYRFMPSLAVDRAGDMALGYSTSSSTTKPAIKYAGRLATDPINTLGQSEQLLIQGTGTQLGNCGGAACIRWGDYSAMTLDPDGCTFWYTNLYYAADGLNHQTRIGSFAFPSCTTVGAGGTVNGTVTFTAGGAPVNNATVALGSRTTTTDASGSFSFTTIPAGTYATLTASYPGYNTATATNIVVTDGGTTTQNLSLDAAVTSACLTDTTQADFLNGVPTNLDLNTSPGDVILSRPAVVDQQNTTLSNSGVGITVTTYGGQTFTPAFTGPLTRADVSLFCSGCTGTTPTLTLSVRSTSGGLPTGSDLVSSTIAGFSSGANVSYTAIFASPITLTAGTMYALVIRPTANPSPGIYALTRSSTDVYAGGTRVSGATSGTVWSIPLTAGSSTDAGFTTYTNLGFLNGDLISSTKDANPAPGARPVWSTIAWTATTPAGTSVQFQAAGSNNVNGPFSFVGPDGTAATFFTSGGSLHQFDGNRYLQYRAFLATTDPNATPTLSDVTVCFDSAPCSNTPAITTTNQVCGGSTGNSASGPAAATYQWSISNGTITAGSTSQTITYTAGASGSVLLTLRTTDPSGCVGSNSTNVPITPTPTITAGGPTTFCDGGSVTLTSSSATGNQWFLGGNPIGGETNQMYVATASGDYTVTVTTLSCTTAASAPTTVTVNPIPPTPTITPGGPTTFCDGGSVTLTSSSVSGNQWYQGGTAITGATNQTYIATTSGDYTVKVTSVGCTSAPSAVTTVTVNPIPATPTITPGGPTTFCEGGSVTLTSSSASGNQWYLNGNPIGGATNQMYSATASGNYTVVVTSLGCSSASSAATSVTVNPIPATPTITPGGPTTFCAGGSVTLTSSSATGNQWYLDSNTIAGATDTHYIATLSGNYTVKVTSIGCTSAPSSAVGVIVNPIPATPTITPGGPTTFCEGGSVTLTSSSADGNQWYLNGNPIGGATNQAYMATASGNYTVVVTSLGCSSAASAAMTVTVNPLPGTPSASNGGPYVTGNTISLSTAFVTGASYSWTGPNGFASPLQNPTIPNATLAAGGTYSVTITVSGCTSTPGMTTVVVTQANRAPVLNPIGNKTIAENSTLTFTISATDADNDPLTYSATNLPSGASFDAGTRTFSWTPTFDQSGTYTNVTFSVSDGRGGTASESITITVTNTNRPPVLAPIGNRSIRGPNQISFVVSASDPDGDSFTLSALNLPSGSTFNPASGTFSWAPTRAQIGSYQVTFQATDSNNAVTAETITISVTFAASDFNGDSHGDILLTDQSGSLVEWQMNGFTITSGALIGTPGSAWRVAATGDFNGDGRTDVILQNNTTGEIAEWQMNGNVLVAGAVIASLGTNWQVATAGDFNGDGRSDLILQNTSTGDIVEWQMNGFSVTGGAIIATLPTTWSVVGAGDFNADGHSDLVLQNSATNEVVVWEMNGMTITFGQALATPVAGWKVKAVGDFNGDGKSDVVLQNTSTRAVAEWQCNGVVITAGLVISTPAPGWVVRGTADYNSDGRSDLLLGNTNSGDVAVWQMNGFSFAGAVVGTPGPAFTPVGK
jgi:Carboxypeptidase regulatory-like domain/Putative Ig domain/FG-GAP-like repeat/Ig-like domain CHU_C associated